MCNKSALLTPHVSPKETTDGVRPITPTTFVIAILKRIPNRHHLLVNTSKEVEILICPDKNMMLAAGLSSVAMALAMLLAVAVRQADVASGEVMEGWNEWSHASWQALSQLPASSSISLWRWSSASLERSTEDSYSASNHDFHGKYASLRSKLDYTYHSNYSMKRQALQDDIIDSILNSTWIMDDSTGNICETPTRPWIVFTAGAMGAGKSWSVRQLAQRGLFPLSSFVTVDPDEIRRLLPEFSFLAKHHPEHAGEWTRKEAGFVAELLTQVSLQQGRNVLVDGSLRDATWYVSYFSTLRDAYSQLQIGILHIVAPRDVVLQRAHERSKTTGRVVPRHTLEDALIRVPRSIEVLRPECDYFAEIRNSHSLELLTGTWESFQQAWSQTCQRQ